MGGGSICVDDDENVSLTCKSQSSANLIYHSQVSLILMTFKIMVYFPGQIYYYILTLLGIGATDIAKLKANGIHTVGVCDCYRRPLQSVSSFSRLIHCCRLCSLPPPGDCLKLKGSLISRLRKSKMLARNPL